MTFSFSEMANAVERHAREELLVLGECEKLALNLVKGNDPRDPRNREPLVFYARPGVEQELAALRRRAGSINEAHALLIALAPIERPVRAALAIVAGFNRLSTRLRRIRGEWNGLRSS